MDRFARDLLTWFDRHGRKDLPWQQDISPYRVWVSEIMLQQTQVTTVLPYYQRFVTRFPTVQELAGAAQDEVLHHWTGLGYYARARNLHRAAQAVVRDHGGRFPVGVDALCALPGIGRSTAGAIAAIAQGLRAPILDGNVKRVLARFHAVKGYPGNAATSNALWQLAEDHTPDERVQDYTQAIMDLGATLCRRSKPDCPRCPMAEHCQARAADATQDYPGRKPAKAKPSRAARMFLIIAPDGACLLEQRPATGIWGGLWTPPERSADQPAAATLNEFGITSGDILSLTEAAPFRHSFSHYHLDIEPVYLRLKRVPLLIRDGDNHMWFGRDGNPAIGLAAPAVKLLASLKEYEHA